MVSGRPQSNLSAGRGESVSCRVGDPRRGGVQAGHSASAVDGELDGWWELGHRRRARYLCSATNC